MATSRSNYITTKPGLETARVSDTLHVAPGEGPLGFFSANRYAAAVNKALSVEASAHHYNSAMWTAQLDDADAGGAGAAATVAVGAGGLVLTAAQANDDVSIRSIKTVEIAAGKVYSCLAKVKVDDADKMGLLVGFATSTAADPLTTAPADGVWFQKAKTATALVGRVVANSGTARDTGTLATIADATDVEIGFRFVTHGTSTALCTGKWYVNGVATDFTSAQLTSLVAMLATTPATLSFIIAGVTSEASAHTVTVSYAFGEVDA